LDGPIARELGLPAAFPLPSVLRILRPPLLEPDCLRSGPSSSPWDPRTSSYPSDATRSRSRPPLSRVRDCPPGRWYAMAAVQVAGVALVLGTRCLQRNVEEAYEVLDSAPSDSLSPPLFIPHLAGARSPSMNTSAQAGFLGLDLRHGRADMLRAVFEGVAFSIAEAADALPEFVDTAALYLAGGGSLHQSWRQLLCDLLGKTLFVVENPNASARGAAMLGGRARGPWRKAVPGSWSPSRWNLTRVLTRSSQWRSSVGRRQQLASARASVNEECKQACGLWTRSLPIWPPEKPTC